MKKLLLLLALSLAAPVAMCQIDTIYSAGKTIPCNVVEVGSDAVKFTYPGETAANTLYVNVVTKIVFRSGRTQEFAETTSFRKLRSPNDFENVAISRAESEIKGLYKLGEVSAKAKGTTEFSNQERVKMRAIRKLKMDAVMLGANVVFIYDMRSDGNKVNWSGFGSSQSAETSVSGIAYTNAPINIDEVKHLLNNASGKYQITHDFVLRNGDSEMKNQNVSLTFELQNIVNESGTVFVQGTISKIKANRFQVVFVDAHNVYVRHADKSAAYVYQINL